MNQTSKVVDELQRREQLGELETLLAVYWGPDGVVITSVSSNTDRDQDLVLALGGISVLRTRIEAALPENLETAPGPGPKAL